MAESFCNACTMHYCNVDMNDALWMSKSDLVNDEDENKDEEDWRSETAGDMVKVGCMSTCRNCLPVNPKSKLATPPLAPKLTSIHVELTAAAMMGLPCGWIQLLGSIGYTNTWYGKDEANGAADGSVIVLVLSIEYGDDVVTVESTSSMTLEGKM